jgi:hypothetical protein
LIGIRRFSNLILVHSRSFAALLFLGLLPTNLSAGEPGAFATGSAFRRVIEQPVSATEDESNLRMIVRGLEDLKHVSILLDRRLDPTAMLSASAAGESLRDFLERLAGGSNARATVLGNTIYLGPPPAAEKLRTIAAIRRDELFDKQSPIPERRRIELTRGSSVRWADLDRPIEIIERLTRDYALAIEGLEQVPHDLWAAATLPDAGAIEALSLVLVQFDLTFAWTGQGEGIRIVPIPERVAIERPHDPAKGLSADASLARWKEQIPGLEARVERGKVHVSGTLETHEFIERLRRGGRVPDKAVPPEAMPLKPLKFERYTLQIKNKPASALLEALGQPTRGALSFVYDQAELKAAGIDLDKLVTFEVKNATIEGLLKATFDPLGLAFEIDDRTVKLKPARKTGE